MAKQIRMDEIPFAPVMDAQLCDTIPPTAPPKPPAPYKRPLQHRLIGWRNDGGLLDAAHDTLENAQAAARELHWAIYWKYAIQCGRDMVERNLINEPAE